MPGLFPGQNETEAARRAAVALEKLKICFAKMDAGMPRRSWLLCQDRAQRQLSTGHHAGTRAISRRLLSRKAPRRSFASDARWRRTESGTRKTGTSTSGNRLMSSFGRSKANNWNGEGEVKNPAVTATTRSASPNRFHAETRSAFSRGPRRYAIATTGARTPTRTSPRPAGQANNPGSLPAA